MTKRRLIKAIPWSVIVDLDGRFIFIGIHSAAANQQQRRVGAHQGFRENDRTRRKHITYVTLFFSLQDILGRLNYPLLFHPCVLCPPVVQLTCMAYDLVALRTSPELGVSMRNLEEAYHQCRAAVCGDQELEMDDCPDPTATPTPPQM